MNAEIAAALRDIFRVGEVVKTDPETCTAVVTFPDTDDVISAPLAVAQRKTHEDKNYWMPDVGELVGCIFLGNGPIAGFVMFAIYNQVDTPPIADNDKHYTQYKDKTLFEYDRKKHELTSNIKGNVIITVEGNEGGEDSEAADGTVDIEVKDAIKIKGKSLKVTIEDEHVFEATEITITSSADTTVEVGGNLNVKATGNTTVESTGNIKVSSTGNMDMESTGNMTLNSVANMTLSPTAMFKINKMTPAIPQTGPLNCLPNCLFAGPPHGGNTVV